MTIPVINLIEYRKYVNRHYESFSTGRIKPASYAGWTKIRKVLQEQRREGR